MLVIGNYNTVLASAKTGLKAVKIDHREFV